MKTLMVHLELDGKNAGLLNIAADLANKFDAHVIGIAACQPTQMLFDEGLMASEAVVADRTEMLREITVVEAEFRHVLEGRVKHLQFRSAITFQPLASYIADEVRAADLIITRPDRGASMLDDARRVKVGDLAIKAGRPLLIVPYGISALTLKNAFVAWKDSPEARRAVADAMPLLKWTKNVTVLEATTSKTEEGAHERGMDVVRWLEAHNVSAEPVITRLRTPDADGLRTELVERGCDFLVAGAYGHSRAGEFFFGGVTRDLLLNPEYCVLISH